MERAGLVTSGTEGAAPRIPGRKRSRRNHLPQGGQTPPCPSLSSAFGLTLFSSDRPVEQGVEQQLEGSRISQAVENLEDIWLGEEPFPTI